MALPPLNTVVFQGINPAYRLVGPDGKPDSNFLTQFNSVVKNLVDQVNAIVIAYNAAVAAQAKADAADAAAGAAQTTADGAQADADSLMAAPYITYTASGLLTAERVLGGGTGVTIDLATAGKADVKVNALTILNAATVALTQPVTMSQTLDVTKAATFAAGIDVTGVARADSLRLDQTPTTAAVVQTDWVPIDLNGKSFKLLLGA